MWKPGVLLFIDKFFDPLKGPKYCLELFLLNILMLMAPLVATKLSKSPFASTVVGESVVTPIHGNIRQLLRCFAWVGTPGTLFKDPF